MINCSSDCGHRTTACILAPGEREVFSALHQQGTDLLLEHASSHIDWALQ